MKASLLRPSKKAGFALIITVVLLSFLVLLLVSLASLTKIETQVASNSQDMAQARQNAFMGLTIALGQLQKYAGPDQRVTFPATTYYPAKDVTTGTGELYDGGTNLGAGNGYRKLAATARSRSYLTKAETYLTPTEHTTWNAALNNYWNNGTSASTANATVTSRNPYWTGVMDSSLRVDRASNPAVTPSPLTRQQYETISGNTTYGEFKRDQLPVWLVSGVEKYTIDQSVGTAKDATGSNQTATYLANYSPNAILTDPSSSNSTSVWLVNNKSATLSSNSTDGLDGRVRVEKQPITANMTAIGLTNNTTIGHYAYWVGDESTKANVATYDPYNVTAAGTTNYNNRLNAPQRTGWDRMTGFSTSSNATLIAKSNAATLRLLIPNQMPALDSTFADSTGTRGPVPRNFHSLTTYSKGLLTDTALGGLKKDLFVYLNTGTGLSSTAPIADPSRYSATDARFKAWGGSIGNGTASSYNTGFPTSTTIGSAALDGIPTWGQLYKWYQPSTNNGTASTNGGAITPDAATGVGPVLTYCLIQNGLSYDPASRRIRWHTMPCLILWNPYDVPLASSTYNISMEIGASYNFYLCQPYPANGLTDLNNAAGLVGGKPVWQQVTTTANATYTAPDGTPLQQATFTGNATTGTVTYANYTAGGNQTIFQMTTGKYCVKLDPANADNYNMKNGPWVADSDVTNGLTDAFGRIFYQCWKTLVPGAGKVGSGMKFECQGSNSFAGPLGAAAGGAPRARIVATVITPTFCPPPGAVPDLSVNGNVMPGAANYIPSTTLPLQFTLTDSFNAGQAKVFTIQSRTQWDPTGSAAVPLTNFYPSTNGQIIDMYYDIMEVNVPAGSTLTAPGYIHGSTTPGGLFWNVTRNSNYFLRAPIVSISIGGTLLYKTQQFGLSAVNRPYPNANDSILGNQYMAFPATYPQQPQLVPQMATPLRYDSISLQDQCLGMLGRR